MRVMPPLLVLLVGCGGGRAPAWAALHGTVREAGSGLEGHLVWELFDKKWGRSHASERHVCARVQAVSGAPETGLEGCDDCAVWALASDELDSDCAQPWDTDGALAGPTHLAFGPMPPALGSVGAHGDVADGWYLSWDGVALTPHGAAHEESLDLSPAVAATRTTKAWVLTPASAWWIAP